MVEVSGLSKFCYLGCFLQLTAKQHRVPQNFFFFFNLNGYKYETTKMKLKSYNKSSIENKVTKQLIFVTFHNLLEQGNLF